MENVKISILWNSLLELKEKFNSTEMHEFAAFMDDSLLVDIPCKGKKFTWYSGDGKSISRIDRFIVSSKVVNDWGVVGQLVGERDVSDHCPIWVEGRGDYVLKEKLRLLKERLRWCNKEVFGRKDLDVEEGVKDINIGDDRLELEAEDLHLGILKNMKEATSWFWSKLRIKENMLVQKSRVKWLNECDSNNDYFHKVMKERRRHNHMGLINSSEGNMKTVKEVKEEVVRHFSSKFGGVDGVTPSLDGIVFDKISEEDRGWLESPFQDDEIKEAIGGCGISKSPGPNRFSFLFIKRCWSFLRVDFMRFFDHFFEGGELSKAVTSSF
ncbi:uncharacterized protein LOC131636401 [Vicia villosa]|uniref:uncharacterized protein LOC131636401 n=1 Tax=Vicia villosa TaxID=3911 RepID=UPI00273CA88C|nr:uncharacterized protein LOC131636401 [Vicia villosa]